MFYPFELATTIKHLRYYGFVTFSSIMRSQRILVESSANPIIIKLNCT